MTLKCYGNTEQFLYYFFFVEIKPLASSLRSIKGPKVWFLVQRALQVLYVALTLMALTSDSIVAHRPLVES